MLSVAPTPQLQPSRGLRATKRRVRRSTLRASSVAAPPPQDLGTSPAVATVPPFDPLGAVTSGLPAWRQRMDIDGFGRECRALEKELKAGQGDEDMRHLEQILGASVALYWAGIGAAAVGGWAALPLAALAVSTATMARWTMVGHHVCHGGYSREQSEGDRFHRRTFARGVARARDWLDWMQPEAWDVEHNQLHHYALGESADPDLVERNFASVRSGKMGPMPLRYAAVAWVMATWKWFYYAPNTLKELRGQEAARAEKAGDFKEQPFKTGAEPTTVIYAVEAAVGEGRWLPAKQMLECMAPYALSQFALVPAVAGVAVGAAATVASVGASTAPTLAVLGAGASGASLASLGAVFGSAASAAAGSVLLATLLAEVATNLHSFVVIATNHVGEDVYRFTTPVKPKTGDFYLRAIIGSANFATGAGALREDGTQAPAGVAGQVNDYLHGWLNYQAEHHAFPSLSMLSYQKAQPRLKEICARHGVPYLQESVFERLRKTVDVMVGKADMLVYDDA